MSATLDITDMLTSTTDLETTVEELGLRFIEHHIAGEPHAVLLEDDEFYYIDLRHGLGYGVYDKLGWSLEEAIENQIHLFDENYN